MKKNINVLHLVSGDLSEGAARGAYWFHQGLIKNGIQSKVLTNSKNIQEYDYIETNNKNILDKLFKKIYSLLDALPSKFYLRRKKNIFSSGLVGIDITKHDLYEWADVINLHWVNDGFINIKYLKKINKPLVWTMRDMWPMTGGCHYALKCERFKNGCGKCVQLGSKNELDISSYIIKRKNKYIPKGTVLVGISNWISDQARTSFLYKNHNIKTISNGINLDNFEVIKKELAKKKLGLETQKKIILCGAKSVDNFYKGFSKFIEAIKHMDTKKYFLCFFGNLDESSIDGLGFEYKKFGFIQDKVILNNLYSSADVFVAPSLMEAFGKTITEAMASGTPTVCFDQTGPKDIVSHMVDGFLAKPFDSDDLAYGINWICSAKNYEQLCLNARNKVVEKFDSNVVSHQYIELYNDLIKNK